MFRKRSEHMIFLVPNNRRLCGSNAGVFGKMKANVFPTIIFGHLFNGREPFKEGMDFFVTGSANNNKVFWHYIKKLLIFNVMNVV